MNVNLPHRHQRRQASGLVPSLGRIGLAGLCSTLALAAATPAMAQFDVQDSSVLVRPAIPEGFDRGGNVSVSERSRFEFDPIGLRAGSIQIFPRIGVGAGATSNVYLSPDGKGDVFGLVTPAVDIRSDWSRHAFAASASGTVTRYASSDTRNSENFNLATSGRMDIGSAYNINAEAQYAQFQESPEFGGLSPELSALSIYRRLYLRLGARYQVGQGRILVSVDHTGFDFSNIKQASGAIVDQGNRDRTINRVAAQLEYATTPSFYLYAQVSAAHTKYPNPLSAGIANRDSDSYRALGGASFDLAGLFRGQLGIGYTWRNYDSSRYAKASGLSVEGKLEYFLSELTTVTLQVARTLEDASLGSTNAYFDNRLSLKADHELLRNLLIGLEGRYSQQHYLGFDNDVSGYGVAATARYMATRNWSIDSRLGYTRRNASQATSPFSETRGEVSLRYAL